MYKKHQIGKFGEDIATQFLIENNYEIVGRNFNCKQGEIDIIAKEQGYLVFIEVKTRSYVFFGNPIEAVNIKKQKNIYEATKYYLYKNKLEDVFIRFDVIEVYIMGDSYKVNHIKQVV